ncbi:general substrate transporter [Xylariaceae sp. FL1272]|nr:general substrate transporter [Xylariaceae sp. FL1272]
MAGGVKKPVNIFKLKDLGEPKSVFNWRLWFAVVSFGLLGAARGVDEGLINGAFDSKVFQSTINYDSYGTAEQAQIKANVSAMVQVGSVAGALIAFLVCDRIGRIWATRQLCVLWILGIAIFMGHGNSLGAVTTVVGPVYIAEIAPASIRGLCTCVFTGAVYLGIVLAYFTNYGSQVNLGDTTNNRWLVPTSLHIIFAGIIFILTFFQTESPRYLVKKGKYDQAVTAMSRIRQLPSDHPYLIREMSEIRAAHEEEMEATMGSSWTGVVKEMFLIPSNAYRLYLALSVQLLSQWSGAGSITLYAPDLFELLGVSGTEQKLLTSAVFGIVKLVSALLCALFLVDVIGRKRISLQAISVIYIAGFLTAVPELGIDDSYVLPPNEKSASRGAIAMIFGWALGWNSMQYLLTAELFPLRIRALSTSLAMTLHFVNQYGNSRAVPVLLLPTQLGGITPKGTFWFFSAVTVLGGVWVWFFVPETGGRSLESMNRLFALPWYQIGRHGNEDAERMDVVHDEKEADMYHGEAKHVEVGPEEGREAK